MNFHETLDVDADVVVTVHDLAAKLNAPAQPAFRALGK